MPYPVRQLMGRRNRADDAIRRALELLPLNGGTLLFEPADYEIKETVALNVPCLQLLGENGSPWRANDFNEVPATTQRSACNIIGVTSGMTVFECNGTDGTGKVTQQAGPIIEKLSFFDGGGMQAGLPGTMTLFRARNVNGVNLRKVGLFWASEGFCLQRGVNGDCADWSVENCVIKGCGTGGTLDTYHGAIRGGWGSLCGRVFNFDMTEESNGRPNGAQIDGFKFDILEPTPSVSYAPGIGIQVGTVGGLIVSGCTFEHQPGATPNPTTIGIDVNPKDSQSTRVTFRDCTVVDMTGIYYHRGRYLHVSGYQHIRSNHDTGGVPYKIDSCLQAQLEPVCQIPVPRD